MARLAIIGAGPKGAAIVVKAAALRTANHHIPPPDIDLYDHDEVGAAWRGSSGYTDGVQPLCTLAERDLGFPYDPRSYGPGVAQAMVADFSWQSFAINSAGRSRYCDWVVNGRHPPRHIDFADYLKFAVDKAVNQGAARLVRDRVSAIGFDDATGTWRINSNPGYDGVVITGSGRPLRALDGANSRVFDGRTFWEPDSHRRMHDLLSADRDASVLIIGAGGTAAAIAYSFVRKGLTTLPITIIGREATLFARHDGPFEDRLFTDDDAWLTLPPHIRNAFLARTTAAVVWDYVLRNLVSDNITYECYNALRYHTVDDPVPELRLEMQAPHDPDLAMRSAPPLWRALKILFPSFGLPPSPPAPPIVRRPGTVIIDARGFDRWAFSVDFFAPTSPLRDFFAEEKRRPQIQSDIAYDLSVRGTLAGDVDFPQGLHVPGLGAMQGPSATNLMGLGWLADRVLSTYCQPGRER
jgi:mycobactin lysine-N-oxygenase